MPPPVWGWLLRSGVVPRVVVGLAVGLLSVQAAQAVGWERSDLPGTGSYSLTYIPASVDPAQPSPAVVFLHGSGATPEQWKPFLAPLADELGLVLIVPRASDDRGFGVGADDVIVERAIQHAGELASIDPRRIGLAGHSAGGAYALVLAYGSPSSFSGVFALSAPYRIVIRLADPERPPPLRLYYGTLDPNYTVAFGALKTMLGRLGVPLSEDVQPGVGHSDIPSASMREGLSFLRDQPVPSCLPTPTAMCLHGRFRVEASWETGAAQGSAGVVKLTADSGYLWFFAPTNVEVSVKVLDACSYNDRWWVFAAGTTDVRVVLTVTDTLRGRQATYVSPRGTAFRPVLDTGALPTCH